MNSRFQCFKGFKVSRFQRFQRFQTKCGVQYSRAIRAYYKKFGRYPTKIEDLENTSNLRFLRKRYKDPMNCKNTKCADFKLLHYGEVQMSLSGIGGGTIPGANPMGAAGLNGSTGFPQ